MELTSTQRAKRKWYAENKAFAKQYMKDWRAKNRERTTAKQKEYYQKNKEKIKNNRIMRQRAPSQIAQIIYT